METIPGSNYHASYWNTSVSLSYPVLKWLNSSLSYSHYYQQSEGNFNQTIFSNQVLLSLSTSMTPWRPF